MPIYKMDGKKDGKQRYRVRVNCIDNYGKAKQHERIAYGLDSAKQLERELLYKIKEEVPAVALSIENLFAEYIKVKKYEVRETTLNITITTINRYVLPYLKDIKLNKLTIPKLQEWKRSIEELNLSVTTRKDIYGVFCAMLNFAVKMQYISKNPLPVVGNFKDPLEQKREMKYYTAEEFKKFIEAAKEIAKQNEEKGSLSKWNFYVFFNIAFFTGMRKGEINALQWTDIKGNCISITKSVAQKLKGGDRITPPKNRSSIRTIQIPEPLSRVLNEHYSRSSGINGFSEQWFICGGIRPIRDTSIQKELKRYADTAGVKVIRVHDFRHSHASLLANEGINIQEVARRLGHSQISMTWNTYSHLYPREEERAIQILNKIV